MSKSDEDETQLTAAQDDIGFSSDEDDVSKVKPRTANNNTNNGDEDITDNLNNSGNANDDEDDIDEDRLLRDDDDDEDDKGKDESEEEPDDDDDLDKDSDDEERESSKGKSNKLKRSRPQQEKKKSKKRKGPMTVSNFFLGEADVASDDEEEPEYENERINGAQQDVILDRDEQAARDAIDARHEANKKRHAMSAEDIAAEIEARHKQDTKMKQRYAAERGDGNGGIIGNVQVAQQSFLPSVLDPKIFKVKCKPGNELTLLRAVMLKTIDVRNAGGLLKIKSAFISDAKGFIYIEAINEAFAKEVIQGLRMLYATSFEQIPVPEMTSVLTVTIKKKPLKINQWVRLKRGPLKGDLARIVDLFEGGSKAFIQAVPRPDYSVSVGALDGKKAAVNPATKGNAKIRPQQRLFDPEEAKSHQATVLRRHHPLSSSQHSFDVWNNEYYRDGFMFKEVTAATYIDESNVNPRLEELQLFHPRKTRRDGDDDEDADDMESTVTGGANNQSFIKELAEQIAHMGEDDDKAEGVNPFMPGDLVQVTGGDLRNLVARVTAVNDMARVATIVPYNNDLMQSFNVEIDLLVKYIFPGAHVKVVAGRFMGQTGRVVSVNSIDGDFVAAILTDGINTEIQCNVSHLQMSSEVTTGHGNLLGYELYDLVSLSENETAIVVMVGAEKLRVMNQQSVVKEVAPQEVTGKRNFQSSKNTVFDSQQNTIGVNDTVKVISGTHAKLMGTIKHVMKGFLWLHNNSHLKNSGIFVVRNRECVVAGGKTATPILSSSYRGVLAPTPTHPVGGGLGSNQSTPNSQQSRTPSGPAGGGYKIGRDPSLGITVRITKGTYKGMLGVVVDVTPTHFSVELSAKMKRIVIERNVAVPVGDKSGSFVSEKRAVNVGGAMEVPSTPYLTSQTPMHYAGSETPRFALGNETPMYGSETPSRTPRAGDDGQDIWKVSQADAHTQQSPQTVTPLSVNSHSNSSSNPWNLHNNSGYGSGLGNSRPLDQYSPANSSSNYSMAGTPLNASGGGSGSSFREWSEDMVGVIRKGPYTGKMCVIQHRVDQSGMVQVSLRLSNGSTERNAFSVHYDDLVLAEPGKREMAMVVSGKHKGRQGTVKNIIGRDVILDLGSGPQEMFKMASVAWMNRRS